jgi:hypothetical protein
MIKIEEMLPGKFIFYNGKARPGYAFENENNLYGKIIKCEDKKIHILWANHLDYTYTYSFEDSELASCCWLNWATFITEKEYLTHILKA